jgi:Aldehyde dehydrogenase family
MVRDLLKSVKEGLKPMLDLPTTPDGWLARAAALKIEGRAFIGGAYVATADGATFAKISPVDGKVFAHVADCGAVDIDRAVGSARGAFDSGVWRDADPVKKKKVLLRFADLIREHGEELALLETLDVGKPIANSLAVDVPFCANCILYYAEFADKLADEIAPTGPNDVAVVRKEPLGVVGAIVPGTIRSSSPPGSWGRRWLRAIRSCSSRPSSRRSARCCWTGSPRRPGCRTACSMSFRASARRPASRSLSIPMST